jgi:hypothetical protein
MPKLTTDTVLDVDFCLCSGVWVSATVDNAGHVGSWTATKLRFSGMVTAATSHSAWGPPTWSIRISK